MPDITADDIKRFDVVLMEVSINRYRKGLRDPAIGRDMWKASWNQVNWSTKLQLESISLLVSADPKYEDESFPLANGLNRSISPAKSRGIEI